MKSLTRPEIWKRNAHLASRSGSVALWDKEFFSDCHLAGSGLVANEIGNLAARQDCVMATVRMRFDELKRSLTLLSAALVSLQICRNTSVRPLKRNKEGKTLDGVIRKIAVP